MGGQCQTRYVFWERYIGGRNTLTVVFVVNLFCSELKHGGVFFENGIVTGGLSFLRQINGNKPCANQIICVDLSSPFQNLKASGDFDESDSVCVYVSYYVHFGLISYLLHCVVGLFITCFPFLLLTMIVFI